MYPLLRRLKGLGRLATYWQESDSGPPRQYYRLSEEGKERLGALRSEWQELVAAVDDSIVPASPSRGVRGERKSS